LSLYDRSKAEVQDLHRCMFEWCSGQVADVTSAWERIKRSWAPGFRRADGEGLTEGSKCLLDLQVRFNESVDDPLRAVWIEGFTGHEVAGDLFQAFYEEWRATASGQERGRAWSALLRSAGEGPHGLEWVHAHRSWLAEDARPSFRPPEAFLAPAEGDSQESADGEGPSDVCWAPGADEAALDPASDSVPWGGHSAPDVVDLAPTEAVTDAPPLTAIRAFFGDEEAQAIVGRAPPVFDQHDPDCWLRELRKGGPEAVLRAGLVVLGRLLEPWSLWFPEETAPRRIHESLARFLASDAQGLADAKALAKAARDSSSAAKVFEPDGRRPEDFRAYVQATNAAEAAARLADGAGGSALAVAVKLSPVLAALSQETRLALRAGVLQAFAGQGD
jgi:hypothetical protein